MEIVSNRDEISSLNDNKINGNPKMERSKITFAGKNNILFCSCGNGYSATWSTVLE